MDSRQIALENWLNTVSLAQSYQLCTMAGDASFRRYFRVQLADRSYVAMDAPPGRESCVSYMAISQTLRHMGLQTPEIIANDVQQGFLLLTDFGDQLYLKTLNTHNAEKLYSRALNALTILHRCQTVPGWQVPPFTADFMRQELQLFKEWFLQKHCALTLSTATEKMLADSFDFLATTAAQQPQVFMHRDYHSANLMVLTNDEVGILDFQDAFIGPVTYDLVSLLRDCYIDWPEELVHKLALQYHAQLTEIKMSQEEFLRSFDLMGVQRHLKALLTFARKYHRDQDPRYLQYMPRTLNYISTISARYPECHALKEYLQNHAMERAICVQ